MPPRLKPFLATLLLGSALALPAGAKTNSQTLTVPAKPMPSLLARSILRHLLESYKFDGSITNIRIDRHELRLSFARPTGEIYTSDTFAFAKLKSVALDQNNPYASIAFKGMGPARQFRFGNRQDALMFANAFLILKEAETKPDDEESAFAAFAESARREVDGATPPPPMSEEAFTFRLLAEEAFKRKDFPAALYAYCDALALYPFWPEGRYNAALLAAEIGHYELAAHHMRRYLVLAPDAADAADSKNKLLIWQHKANQ